jgi:transposase
MLDLDVTKLVFIDESGFKTNINRHYGWAPRGEKPILIVPKYGRHVTIVGAIAVDGVRATSEVEGSFDGDEFISFLANHLGPNLRPGDIVVMDGPRLHRVDGVAEALAAHGATALYLPAYSPELNPIEMCWSVMKARVRRWAPRAMDRLISAVTRTWETISAVLCVAWIRHCGYAVQAGPT